jgi:putative two-component system response regulator
MYHLTEKEVSEALVRSVNTVTEEMAFLNAKRVSLEDIASEPAFFIHLQAPVRGALILSILEEDKKRLAGFMYGKEPALVTGREANECLLEFVNVVSGQFIQALEIEKIEYVVGIPKLFSREGDLYSYAHSYDFFFNAEGIRFKVRLLLNRSLKTAGLIEMNGDVFENEEALVVCVAAAGGDRDACAGILRDHGLRVETADNAYDGLTLIKERRPHLILLDTELPLVGGIKILRHLKNDKSVSGLPVIMLSSRTDPDIVSECFRSGADDFLRKPFGAEELLAHVRLHVKNRLHERSSSSRRIALEREVLHKARELDSMKDATILALAKLAESRDPDTASHLERIMEYVKIIAQELAGRDRYDGIIDREFIHNIYRMSALHDIGKVGIPDTILLKKGRLTAEEFEIMKQHTVIGFVALDVVCRKNQSSLYLIMARDIARHHHEKWDGTGYPDGLRGEKIPLAARITTLADVYDALSTKRIYKDPYPPEEVDRILERESGSTFDPDVFDAYLRVKSDFLAVKQKYDYAMTTVKPGESDGNT